MVQATSNPANFQGNFPPNTHAINQFEQSMLQSEIDVLAKANPNDPSLATLHDFLSELQMDGNATLTQAQLQEINNLK